MSDSYYPRAMLQKLNLTLGLVVTASDWDCVRDRTCFIGTRGTSCLRNMRRCWVKTRRGYRCPSGLGGHGNCSVWQHTLLGVCGDLNCEGMGKLLPSSWLTQWVKLLPEKPCPQTASLPSPCWLPQHHCSELTLLGTCGTLSCRHNAASEMHCHLCKKWNCSKTIKSTTVNEILNRVWRKLWDQSQ